MELLLILRAITVFQLIIFSLFVLTQRKYQLRISYFLVSFLLLNALYNLSYLLYWTWGIDSLLNNVFRWSAFILSLPFLMFYANELIGERNFTKKDYSLNIILPLLPLPIILLVDESDYILLSNLYRYVLAVLYGYLVFNKLYLFYKKNINFQTDMVRRKLRKIFIVIIFFIVTYLSSFVHYLLEILKSDLTLPVIVPVTLFFITANLLIFYALKYSDFYLVNYKGKPKEEAVTNNVIMLKEELEVFMRESKPYLNPELTLLELADILGMKRNTLSALINEQYGMNFNSYINDYRLKHFLDFVDRNPGMSILEMMYQSGFNSKSVFNNLFKKTLGCTPKEYLLREKGSER